MNSRTLAVLAVGSFAAIIAAFLSLNSESGSTASSSSSPEAASQGPAQQTARAEMVRKMDSPDVLHPSKAIPKIEKVDPKKYSTGPNPDSHEAKIFKLVMELGTPDDAKVKRLLAMIPELPHASKLVALEHAAQLIPDDDYIKLRPQLLRLANTDELREVVMLDVLTRDDTIKMPGLVELMKLPHGPVKADAREVLEAYLENDYGDDPKQWDAPVRQWLAENADI